MEQSGEGLQISLLPHLLVPTKTRLTGRIQAAFLSQLGQVLGADRLLVGGQSEALMCQEGLF